MTTNRAISNAFILAVTIAVGASAFAKKPDSPGNSEAEKSAQGNISSSSNTDHDAQDSGVYFNQERRALIRNYYAKQPQSGNCPPGLAKKNNGCLPPGQAKKWRKGETLPSDVAYHDFPSSLVEQLGYTPGEARIVRIDSEVLLIGTATRMVLDAFDLHE